jgi:hypothetical protein
MNKIAKILCCTLLVTTGALMSGCATILSGSNQTINVKVLDENQELVTNAKCSITDGIGNVYPLVGNPATVTISKGTGAVIVNCKKPGYRQMNMAVGDNFNALTVVNVLFWPGFIVDVATGAYKKYPSHYMINMERA